MTLLKRLLPVLVLLAAAGSPACAEFYTITVTPTDLGGVAGGVTGTTTFQANPATGAVTRLSGSAVRLASTTARALVSVTCTTGTGLGCGLALVVTLHINQTGTPTNRASALQNFTVSTSGGTATIAALGAPNTGNSVNFAINNIPNGATRTFYVGFDFPLGGDNSAAASGNATASFIVTADSSGTSSPGTGTVTAKVVRSITVTNSTPLAFGRIIRPRTGSGTVSLAATTGVVSTTGGAFKMPSPASSAAAFSVSGEGGQAFSISVPTSFNLVKGPDTIAVTLSPNITGTQTLSGSLGSAGTLPILVGGSFPLLSTTPLGAYTGTFGVTVTYN
jgi:hypothetical protein